MKKTNFLFIFVFIFSLGFAQTKKINTKKLDDYIQRYVTKFDLAGLAIGIVQDGKVVFQKGYGLRNINRPSEKVSTKSMFGIASLSKAFTAMALGILVEEGKIAWDDKVKEYMPEFEMYDPYVSREMTIRDLLCHRSGLNTFDGDLLWYNTNYSRAEVIRRIRFLPPKKSFRANFGYQNIMFITAGELIPRLTGMSWDKFLEEKIFKKLLMQNTNTSIKKLNSNDEICTPHVKGKPEKWINYDSFGGAAAINSNVEDVCKWIQTLLQKGKGLVSENVMQEMWKSHTPLALSNYDRSNGLHFKGYGLGWFLMDYHGKKVVHHSGGLPGFISKIALIPEENLGVIILTNGETSLPTALMYKVFDEALGKNKGRDWGKEYLGFAENYQKFEANQKKIRENEREQNTKPSLKLESYEGTYKDKMYGEARIKLENGKLALTLLPAKEVFTSEMKHWHFDTFQIKFKDPFLPEGWVSFELDSWGNVKGFKIDLPNNDFHFYNLYFEK